MQLTQLRYKYSLCYYVSLLRYIVTAIHVFIVRICINEFKALNILKFFLLNTVDHITKKV